MRVLRLTAIAECATGLALLAAPALVVRLLLGSEISSIASQPARVAGIALIGLGVSCWPGPPMLGMLCYSAIVTLYLGWLGIAGSASGAMLWPAVGLHAVLSALLAVQLSRAVWAPTSAAPTPSGRQATTGSRPRGFRA